MRSTVTLQKEVMERLEASSLFSVEYWNHLTSHLHGTVHADLLQMPETDLITLADELSLTPESIVDGEIDYRALEAHQAGHITWLPESYSDGESRIRTSAHLFDLVETLFGWRDRVRLLRRHQLTEAVIADPEIRINVRFITDLCDDLKDLGVRDDQFHRMGEHSLVRNYHSPVGQELRNTRNSRELLEKCFTQLVGSHYDRNHTYHVATLDHEHMTLDVHQNPDICHSIRSPRIGSRLTCLNRTGAIASLLGYRHMPFAQVHESRCVHSGDPCCRIEIDFSNAAATEKRSPVLF